MLPRRRISARNKTAAKKTTKNRCQFISKFLQKSRRNAIRASRLVCLCDAPKSADRVPKLSKEFSKSSEGLPTPGTSPPRPPTPPTTQIRQYSWHEYVRKEVCMHIRTLKPFKSRMEKEELKFKHPGSTNCRNHNDVMVSGVIAEPNNDVTIRDIVDVNRPVARKCYAPRKQSLVHSKAILKSSLRVYSRTFTFIALILAIVISVVRGLFNIRLPE